MKGRLPNRRSHRRSQKTLHPLNGLRDTAAPSRLASCSPGIEENRRVSRFAIRKSGRKKRTKLASCEYSPATGGRTCRNRPKFPKRLNQSPENRLCSSDQPATLPTSGARPRIRHNSTLSTPSVHRLRAHQTRRFRFFGVPMQRSATKCYPDRKNRPLATGPTAIRPPQSSWAAPEHADFVRPNAPRPECAVSLEFQSQPRPTHENYQTKPNNAGIALPANGGIA